MKEFLMMKEVAEMLSVHPVTVNRYCKQGILTYYQVGQRKRFVKEDVENFIKGAKRDGTENSNNPFNTD